MSETGIDRTVAMPEGSEGRAIALTDKVKQTALDGGAELVGVADVAAMPEQKDRGRQEEMRRPHLPLRISHLPGLHVRSLRTRRECTDNH